MRVFVTGATGFIGSAVVEDLLAAGHQVVGLARSDASAKSLESLGVEVLRGSLDDLDTLKRGAAESDGVIHLAFIHDFSDFANSAKKDYLAIQTICAALEGTNRPFVGTTGTLGLTPGRLGREQDAGDPATLGALRLASEELALSFASKGVRSSVIRLSPTVHGKGDHGFVPALISIAREKGAAAYVGEGLNRWPAVHRVDAARLYRLALEKGSAGVRYHGVAEEGVPFRDIAQVIGKHLNVPVVSKTPEEAVAHIGFLGTPAGIDNPTSSKQTQEALGWHPTQPSLLADLEQNYF
ncbi:NAD dependent epimerase/dehydratase family protein [Flammula alnicola]|nr:NAD dependent epimerase/dehydratase family protein [Flammula alnicola]